MPPTPDRPDPSGAPEDASISLNEAARRLDVHYMTAYRYVRTGELEAHQDEGRWVVAQEALDAFVRLRATNRARRSGRRSDVEAEGSPRIVRRVSSLADRLIAGDEPGSWRILDDALTAGHAVESVYLDLVGASLTEVGDRWESGTATVADEHRASVVAMRLIGRLGGRSTRPGRTRGTALVAAVPGDRHAMPTALLADLLRRRGFRAIDLGADTPPEHLASAASCEDRLVAVGLCATTNLTRATSDLVREAVGLVREVTEVPVLLGGAGMDATVARSAGAYVTSGGAVGALEWFESLGGGRRATRSRS